MVGKRLIISEAQPWHCGTIARRMRKAHADAIGPTGTNAHAELRAIYNASAFRRVAHLNGRLLALGGVASTLASSLGYVWLALTEDARKYPKLLVREARLQLAEIMQTHTELATTILADDSAAMRFALYLGFHVGHEENHGRKTQVCEILSNADLRIPIGSTFALPLGYHLEERPN